MSLCSHDTPTCELNLFYLWFQAVQSLLCRVSLNQAHTFFFVCQPLTNKNQKPRCRAQAQKRKQIMKKKCLRSLLVFGVMLLVSRQAMGQFVYYEPLLETNQGNNYSSPQRQQDNGRITQAYFYNSSDRKWHGIRIKVGYVDGLFSSYNGQRTKRLAVTAYYSTLISSWMSANSQVVELNALNASPELLEQFSYKATIPNVGTVYF